MNIYESRMIEPGTAYIFNPSDIFTLKSSLSFKNHLAVPPKDVVVIPGSGHWVYPGGKRTSAGGLFFTYSEPGSMWFSRYLLPNACTTFKITDIC